MKQNNEHPCIECSTWHEWMYGDKKEASPDMVTKRCRDCGYLGNLEVCCKCVNYNKWVPFEDDDTPILGTKYQIYDKCGKCARRNEIPTPCVICIDGSSFASDGMTEKCETISDYAPIKETTKPAATPEPMSKPGIDVVALELVKDFLARDDIGRKKYGTSLQTFNGRDSLNDAYQEVLDLAVYIKQTIMEREDSLEKKIVRWAKDRGLYDSATAGSQLSKLYEEIGEWQDEIVSGDRAAEMMELGDIYVVLVNIAHIRGFSLEQCGVAAYNKIKNRTGHVENGTFVKDK